MHRVSIKLEQRSIFGYSRVYSMHGKPHRFVQVRKAKATPSTDGGIADKSIVGIRDLRK
jgi:hypothetical protein